MAGLLHATTSDLARIKGLGPAKRAELVAVLELARRALAQQLRQAALEVARDPSQPGPSGNGIGSMALGGALGGALGALQFLAPLAAKAFMPLPF